MIPRIESLAYITSSTSQPHYVALKDSLSKAEEIFKEFPNANQTSKDTMVKYLSTAYRDLQTMRSETEKIPSQLETIAARIFFLYGKCLYNGNMQASRRMFELSLAVEFVGLKILKNDALPVLPSTDLESIPASFPAESQALQQWDEFVASTPVDAFTSTICQQDKETAFDIAMTFRWLGATYQNLDHFNKPEYLPLFQKIYAVATKVWEKIGSKDSLWEVAQILYNTQRFVHYLKSPEDVLGALETLKAIEPYLKAEGDSLRAKQLQAQIHNITAVESSKIPVMTKEEKQAMLVFQYQEISKAEAICSGDPRFDIFLKKLFIHNKASRAIACAQEGIPVAEINEIKIWIDDLLAYMENEKYNHYYFFIFLKTAAKFEAFQHHWEAALKHLDQSELVANMYLDSCKNDLPLIHKTRLEILQEAVRLGTKEQVERLISLYPAALDQQDENGKTLVSIAAEAHRPNLFPDYSRADVMQVLLNAGADINIADNKKWTPLYYASRQNCNDLLPMLVAAKADLNAQNSDLSTPLHRLCDRHATESVLFLLENGAHPDVVNCAGTPLFYAASKGYLDLVIALCEKGQANVNLFGDPLEGPPLKMALLNNRKEVVDYLQAHGAVLNVPAFTPMEGQSTDSFGRSAIFYDTAVGKLDDLKKEEQIDLRDFKNRTPLHYAVREGQLEAVKALLERNADLLSRDDQGYFPLFWACQYHQAEIAKTLIAHAEKTGKLNEMLAIKDHFGWSLLRKAAERGNLEMVTLMKEEMTKAGVLTPEEHQQAVASAKINNHSEVVEYLEGKLALTLS